LGEGGNRESNAELIRLQCQRVLPLVRQTANTVQQGEMIQTIAVTLHVPEAVVVTRLAAVRSSVTAPAEVPAQALAALSSDQLLLGLVIAEPVVREVVVEQGAEEFFGSRPAQELWQALRAQQREMDWLTRSADEVVGALPDDIFSYAEALRRVAQEYLVHVSTTPLAETQALVRSLKKEVTSAKLRLLRDRLATLSGDERAATLKEFQTILKELSTHV
jgi:hypothetical protein